MRYRKYDRGIRDNIKAGYIGNTIEVSETI